MTRRLLVCIHDVAPIYASETREMIHDLAPLVGRRLSLGVVPNWHGGWPLASHPGFCRMIRENSDELLLHGYHHQRKRGWGPATFLTEGSDEMNGLDAAETASTLEQGQRLFMQVFGQPARGFIAPAWQMGHAHFATDHAHGLDHVLGFFSLTPRTGRRIPLATWSWDCGRWSWLGHIGRGIGRVSHLMDRGVPVLAIHPADLQRGFWPGILRLTRELVRRGYEPTTPSGLLIEAGVLMEAGSSGPASR